MSTPADAPGAERPAQRLERWASLAARSRRRRRCRRIARLIHGRACPARARPSAPQAFSPSVPTSISARSRSIASTTASATSSGVRVAEPGGSFDAGVREHPGVADHAGEDARRRRRRSRAGPGAAPTRTLAARTSSPSRRAEFAVATLPDERGHEHEVPAAALHHRLGQRRGRGERRPQVDVERAVDLLGACTRAPARRRAGRRWPRRTSTSPASATQAVDGGRASVRSAAIVRPPSSRRQRLEHVGPAPAEHQRAAAGAQRAGDRVAEPARRAGQQHRAALEIHGAKTSRLYPRTSPPWR